MTYDMEPGLFYLGIAAVQMARLSLTCLPGMREPQDGEKLEGGTTAPAD